MGHLGLTDPERRAMLNVMLEAFLVELRSSPRSADAEGRREQNLRAMDKAERERRAFCMDVARDRLSMLTDGQVEVLALIADGLSAKQIAERRVVTETTVRSMMSETYKRLGVYDRAQAALIYLSAAQELPATDSGVADGS